MRFLFLACLLPIVSLSAEAAAQAADPVTSHYRAYTAALASGDIRTAENEARAALSASEAARGESTAVLALNLAQVLLEEGKKDEAVAPAQRAVQLAAERGAASRVNSLAASLALGRAQLTNTQGESGTALLQTIQQAVAAGGLTDSLYDAAVDLGNWALGRDEYPLALQAWQIATDAYSGSDEQSILARAQGLRGVGLTMLLARLYRGPRTTLVGTPLDSLDTSPLQPLSQATLITRTLALRLTGDATASQGQASYAQSLALLHAAYAELTSLAGLGRSVPVDSTAMSGLTVARNHGPDTHVCVLSIHPDRPVQYPHQAEGRWDVGAVVVRIRLRDDGSVAEAIPLATTGGSAFASVARGINWHVEIEHGPVACVTPTLIFVPLTFRIH